ncbi:MAG: FtsK/SpoIIIE domain-containing protein [Oscillospiraceae bacterium]|nr:FtsK/SpoIIIE domain-containing protein [Oscillospiraceae bacterium]
MELNDKASRIFSMLNSHDRDTTINNLFTDQGFLVSPGQLCVPIGIDVNGNSVIYDVTEFPHLLIGGTTGSGKTVFLQSMLAGMIATYSDELLKLIIFDSKGVDYHIFNGMLNLLLPVVTDPSRALEAISWTYTEALKRMKLLSDDGCKDFAAYNEKNAALPYIVVVLDDFSTLSMHRGIDKVENVLLPVLSIGRMVGIHVIIVTSIPTTKIITTSLKANIPSRMSFCVPSRNISKMILDENGAESLSRQGEFIIKSGMRLRKGTSIYADEYEMSSIITAIKSFNKLSDKGTEVKVIDILGPDENSSFSRDDTFSENEDELINEAVDIIFETGQASVSMLQRRLKLSYSRAARLIDVLEIKGIVGAFEGSKPRQILISRQQWIENKTSKD